ncbi:MAG: polyol transport system substrate-binding protein [Gaiellaceae bacterium]|jgi:sorbitol/mannitol transport system substrate-binding protein|nr:polyol transport system substrate-binding protein [Gaiellaceae bacterium]
MRLSRSAMGLCGVIVLSLAVLVGVGSARTTRHQATTLTIATVNNPDMIVMQSLTSAFTKKYGINVKYVTLPENTLRQKVTSDVATGGGQFDIATVGTYDVPIWAKNKWLVSINPYFSKLSASASSAYDLKDVLPKVRLGLSYKNQLYALPFYGESSMTYYNKKLFAAAGLKMPLHPTWDQVATFAAKLNKPSANRYGICLRGLPGWGEFGAPLTTVVNTFGGEWFNMKWEPQLTSPAFEAAANFYVNLIRKSGEPGATSSGFTECETAMAQGRTAMWVDATVAAGQLTDPTKSQVAKDIGFAYAPTKVTPLGSHWLWSWSLAVEASSKNKDAAFKFLTWATSRDYIKLVASKNGWASVPPGTRISTYKNPSYKKAAGAFESIVLNSMLTADPTHSTLHKVPYTGVQFVGIPEFQNIGTLVTQNLAGALAGSTSVSSALSTSQSQVTRIMKQGGYLK